MTQTTARQKIVLFCFGILSALIFLEVFLRIGGSLFNLRQEWNNRQTVAGQSQEYRILCIGESTTALGGENSYPAQLQAILNDKKLNKTFKVINKGLVAKTSKDILAQLEDNLNRYKPDLVVSMIGVNDSHSLKDRSQGSLHLESFLEYFRVYKFLQLLSEHIARKIYEIQGNESSDNEKRLDANLSLDNFGRDMEQDVKQQMDTEKVDTLKINRQIIRLQSMSAQLENVLERNPAQADDQNIKRQLKLVNIRLLWYRMYLGVYYRMKGDYDQARQYFLASIAHDPKSYGPYLEVGRIYKELKDYKRAIYFFTKAHELAPGSHLVLLEMGRCYNEMGQTQDAANMFQSLFDKNPIEFWVYPEIGQWFQEHAFYPQAEAVFLAGIKMNPLNYFLYASLADVYDAQGKTAEAKRFRDQFISTEQQANAYMDVTIFNYNKIADAVLSRGIRLIGMQYPRRNIQPLKDILKNKDKIIFVENKTNFDEALKTAEYSKYFSDNFGSDFGHCTRLGNRLIAEHLAEEIRANIFTNGAQ